MKARGARAKSGKTAPAWRQAKSPVSKGRAGAKPRAASKPATPKRAQKAARGPKVLPVRPSPPPAPVRLSQPTEGASAEAKLQQRQYEGAVRLFQDHKFRRADVLFQNAIQGPNRTLAHHAQIHSQICRKRINPPELSFKTADDHYYYAVTLINTRRLREAAEHLDKALRLAPHLDYVHYALAAAQALQGNPHAAYERLKVAIDLQPRNRFLARGDADFAGIRSYPPVASLLQLGPARTDPPAGPV